MKTIGPDKTPYCSDYTNVKFRHYDVKFIQYTVTFIQCNALIITKINHYSIVYGLEVSMYI